MNISTETLHKKLKEIFGYNSFRGKQEKIIQHLLSGNDSMIIMPTGGGKSMCYQLPALISNGCAIVVSPLIALMKNQVDILRTYYKNESIAHVLNSSLSKTQTKQVKDDITNGKTKLLYVAPESLVKKENTDFFSSTNISFYAIDEAHCISEWGHDFRPEYRKLRDIIESIGKAPIIALTATATPKVVEDIQEKLLFKQKHCIQKSFKRDNLAYVVLQEESQFQRMLRVIRGVGGSGIVYVNRRKKTKEVAKFLLENNISADYYHAGLDHIDRRQKQDRWIQNKCQVVVATNAFGMGIDKPNVRFVIHLDLPQSLEAYFQEAGRGGRDGKKAFAVLLMTPSMDIDLKKQIEQSFPEIATIKKVYLSLGNFFQIPIGSGENQSFEFDIAAFCNRYDLNVYEAYHCLHFLEKEGYIALSENFASPPRIHIAVKKEDLYKFQVSHKKYDFFIKTLLRTYGGLFEEFVKINEQQLADHLKVKRSVVVETLNRLEKLEILHYEAQSYLPKLTYTKARFDQVALRISKEVYHERKKTAFEKMEAVLHYSTTNHRCRSQLLLEYFGEKDSHRCGICDVCLERNKLELSELEFDEIENQLQEILKDKSLSLQELVYQVKGYREDKIIKVIDFLLEHNKLFEKDNQYFTK